MPPAPPGTAGGLANNPEEVADVPDDTQLEEQRERLDAIACKIEDMIREMEALVAARLAGVPKSTARLKETLSEG